MKNEKGFALIEIIIAIALLGIISVAFLGTLSSASMALVVADERATAESLARSQMEYVKNQPYNTVSYSASIPQDYVDAGYTATIASPELAVGLQKITITIDHNSKEIIILEGYKVDR